MFKSTKQFLLLKFFNIRIKLIVHYIINRISIKKMKLLKPKASFMKS